MRHRAGKPISYFAFILIFAFTAAVARPASGFQWIERPDTMQQFMLADWDMLDGRVRVLYQSIPSLEQAVQDGWTVNVYIAEVHPDGRVDNRRLASGQRNYASLLLRRGKPQVFALPKVEKPSEPNTLETWSTADGSLLESFSGALLKYPASGQNLLAPTRDGALFIAETSSGSYGDQQPTLIRWTKFAPDGEILGSGEWSDSSARASVVGQFPARDGGIGLVVSLTPVRGTESLQSETDPVIGFEVGGREIEARIFAETRMLETDSGANLNWVSAALERDLSWAGEMSIPDNLPMDERLAQNSEQMELMEKTALEHGGQRRMIRDAYRGYYEVHATVRGYAVLADVSANRQLQPPRHGPWLIEIGPGGTLLRETYLEPVAEHLEAKFDRFLPTADGGLLVAGRRSIRRPRESFLHVTALDAKGSLEWTSRLAAGSVQLDVIAGNKEFPWAVGHGWHDALNRNLLWVERAKPGSASPPAQPGRAADSRRSRSAAAASAKAAETPRPEGCTCSCEEFQWLSEQAEKMRSLPQSEQIALAMDADFQARMSCMGSCAMQYMNCR